MSATPAPLGIGIDTGGTFTDIVLLDLDARRLLRKGKTPTTHGDYGVGIARAFAALALSPPEVARLRRVALSTTLATNAVAEAKVHPTALLMEPGDIAVPPGFQPPPLLLRSQVDFNAVELVAVSEQEVLARTAPWAGRVGSFAVSCYASTRNPAHERQIAEILRRAYGKPVVMGSELTHQLNFLQRAQAAALNAGLLTLIVEWLRAVKAILAGLGIGCPLYIVKGDGSLMDEHEALERPVQTLFSGPAASLHGGYFLSAERDAYVVDVGGTTTDMGRVRDGRGRLRRGGIRINGRSIAVDGLDITTFGLGGDSRFRLGGRERFQFENRRVLPYCRAPALFPGWSPAPLEAELADQWHFGDPELLELVAVDPLRRALVAGADLTPEQQALLAALERGPLRVRALETRAAIPAWGAALHALEQGRLAVRIGLTPTDLYCAEGHAPAFSRGVAEAMLGLYARMLDVPVESFRAHLYAAIRRQAMAVVTLFLAEWEPPPAPDSPWLERLVELLLAQAGEAGAALALDPGRPLVLVGAGAPVIFGGLAPRLGAKLRVPADGEVANALGAITSGFVLHESVSVEPVVTGGFELFDHQGKRFFPAFADAMAEGRTFLRSTLAARARALGLREPRLVLEEEVLEDYAAFSRRARKELIIARIEGILTGDPA